MEEEIKITETPKRSRSFGHYARKYFREYSEVTGIHGLRYVIEKRSRIEKIIWIIIMLAALISCIYMINQIWQKYIDSPVVVSFGTVEMPISDIPFPAVTICLESKTDTSKFDLLKNLNKINSTSLTQEEERNLVDLALLCNLPIKMDPSRMPDLDDFYQTVENLQIDFEDTFYECLWLGEQFNCSDLFTPIFTDEGICYSFNILNKQEMFYENLLPYWNYHNVDITSRKWNIQDGYKDSDLDTYPMRALLSGFGAGLGVFLVTDMTKVDYACKYSLQGYRVLLHNPLDIPRPSKDYFRVPFAQAVIAAVQPKLVTTSNTIKNYPIDKRECLFIEERKLKYFKMYTQTNCNLECLSDYVLERCGCVAFFMPRYNNTKICSHTKLDCLGKAERNLKFEELQNRLIGKPLRCDCKPLCTDLRYDVETSQSDYSFMEATRALGTINETKQIENINISLLSISFKSEQFLNCERNELYGVSDLISNFGGLIGLFTGFSMITLVEIIYFLTLRLYYNKRLYGHWAGPTD